MKCPKCQYEDLDTKKFCGECGTKLEQVCPNCSGSNPPQYKFCGDCGHNLTVSSEPTPKDLSFDEKIDKIQRYLPQGLTEKILSQRGKIEGERKQVSVMFCDLEGFTPLVEKLGSEDAYHMMDQIYEILIHKVHDYGGTVNEMTGDGVMAIFGAPIAVEDAPQRSIRSAIAIHKELSKFSDEKVQGITGFPILKMRIGIHTGPVVVGTLGNNLRVEFKAVGNTVNLASRMEGLAEPGTTIVSEDTYKLTEGFFRYEALGGKKVKGKKARVWIYRVIAPSSKKTRFDVSAERGLTHFVGRQRELELLIDGFDRSKRGFGNAFSIVSEAGAGKSRLLYEFRKSVANMDITFLEGKCLSFSKNIAYYPIIELLKATFGLNEDDTDFEKIGKVKNGIKFLGMKEDAVLVYLLELLSVKDSGFDYNSMSPESKKDRTLEVLKLITLRNSEIRPMVLAFEDLHWMDTDSEEWIKNLLDSVSGARIFLIFTYRPEYLASWGSRSYQSQINLYRLSNRESLLIASDLLETDNIHGGLQEWIISKTEGVPFFIEEFINYLKDMEAIEEKNGRFYLKKNIQEVSIPSNIHDIIAAKVDTLRETSKFVLHICSAIEKEFSYQLLKQVTGFEDSKLLKVLITLKNAELIFERGIAPDTIYIFKHALTRDVIYDSILTKRKKLLHEDIGNAIEIVYPDRLEDYVGILAEHYFISENYQKAAEYFRLAGKKSIRAVSFTNAITFTEKQVASLERLSPTETVEKQLIDARTSLGFYHLQMQHYESAKNAIAPVIELAEKKQYKKGLAQIFSLRGVHEYLIEEDHAKAVEYLKKAIQMAEETNNFISLIFSNHFLGHVFSENCEFEKGHHFIKKALGIVEMGGVLWSIAIHKACIAFTIFSSQGKIDLAYQSGKEAIQLAEESGDILSKAEAYTNTGACCFYRGSFKKAEDYLLMGRQFSKKANLYLHEYIANFHLGKVYYYLEKYNKAHEYLLNAMSIEGKGILGKSYMNLTQMTLAAVKMKKNEKDYDLEVLRSYISQNKIKRIEGCFRRYFCIILLNNDEEPPQEVKNWIEQAIAMDKENGLPYELGMDHVVYAEFFKRTGNIIKAKERLDNAIDIFKECGADGWLNKIEKELAAL